MRTFLINLKSAVDRKKRMTAQLNSLGISFEMFEAVYGKELPIETAAKYYDMDFYHKRQKSYTAGSVGCALSHFFIYEKIVKEKIPVAFLLEDDMELTEDLPQVLDAIENKIRKDEIIMIYYQSFTELELIQPEAEILYTQYQLFPLVNLKGLTCTGAYCITYDVAKRFIDKLPPLTTFADDWLKFYDKNCFDLMRVVYPFAINNAYLPSDITPYQGKYKIVSDLLNFFNQKKVFPFYQVLKWKRKISYAKTRICKIVDKQKAYYR
jgi:glycosyl transferase family 25